MKKRQVTKIKELISELQKEIDEGAIHRQKKTLVKLFQDQFCLSKEDAEAFLETLDRIVCGASYKAMPPRFLGEFLPELPLRQRTPKGRPTQRWLSRKTPPKEPALKRYEGYFYPEREKVKNAIRELRKLADEPAACLEKKWVAQLSESSTDWKPYLRQQADGGDKLQGRYNATEVANMIIADRWNAKDSTIETYCKEYARKR